MISFVYFPGFKFYKNMIFVLLLFFSDRWRFVLLVEDYLIMIYLRYLIILYTQIVIIRIAIHFFYSIAEGPKMQVHLMLSLNQKNKFKHILVLIQKLTTTKC